MVSSFRPDDRSDAGYATPAALLLSLAISIVVVAITARSLMMLQLAKADLARHSAEFVLDGAHLLAAATVIRAGSGGPYQWALPTDMGFAETLVESEVDKLPPSAAAGLPERVFDAFGVTDVEALKARLSSLSGYAEMGPLDAAPLWRECADSVISSLGKRGAYASPVYAVPSARPTAAGGLPNPPDWRVGEAWRVRITTAAGWRDDRIVRFTGDASHPVAVVRRVLSRTNGGQGRCEAVWAAAA